MLNKVVEIRRWVIYDPYGKESGLNAERDDPFNSTFTSWWRDSSLSFSLKIL